MILKHNINVRGCVALWLYLIISELCIYTPHSRFEKLESVESERYSTGIYIRIPWPFVFGIK